MTQLEVRVSAPRQGLVRFGLVAAMLVAAACGDPVADAPADTGAAALGIDAEALLAATRTLSSDEFEGRAPGSAGEEKTIAFLTEQFSNLGLAPGNPDGTWVQKVPLVGITPSAGDTLTVSSARTSETLEPSTDYVAWTKHVVDEVQVDAEFVFVGYGAVAPEYDWDDFEDVDVTGKILLFLVNDPPVENTFGGRAMTYYGRWTYKHEIAAAKGAAGSLVIHETGPAGYPWEVIGSSPHSESFDLVAPDRNLSRAAVEGWIQRAAAERIFEMAGLDFEDTKLQAAERSFRPIPLGVTGATRVRNTLRTIDSQNFVAKLDGTSAPDEIVMYVAHWDHLGTDESCGWRPDLQWCCGQCLPGRLALIEIARAFSLKRKNRPRRSIAVSGGHRRGAGVFLAQNTMAENPLYPAASVRLQRINMDVLNTWGRTRDLTDSWDRTVGTRSTSRRRLRISLAAR